MLQNLINMIIQEKANNYFATLPEPESSCLLYLRRLILEHSTNITEAWKFNTPFYYYKKRWLCFISYDKKTKVIYVSFVNGYKLKHPLLKSEGRKKMKIAYVNADEDLDAKGLTEILEMATKVSGV